MKLKPYSFKRSIKLKKKKKDWSGKERKHRLSISGMREEASLQSLQTSKGK